MGKNSRIVTLIDIKHVFTPKSNTEKSSKFKYVMANKANISQYPNLTSFTSRYSTSYNTLITAWIDK